MAKFNAVALVFAVVVATAAAQSFPETIAFCGQGACKVLGVMLENGVAVGVGPVSADANLEVDGDYPSMFSLCGNGVCVTVPVMKEMAAAAAAAPAPGTSMGSTCPVDIGLCGDGTCRVTKVNVDANGNAVSVGPVPNIGALGAPGSYPTNVGVCCNGVCTALPVMTGGRKLMA